MLGRSACGNGGPLGLHVDETTLITILIIGGMCESRFYSWHDNGQSKATKVKIVPGARLAKCARLRQ